MCMRLSFVLVLFSPQNTDKCIVSTRATGLAVCFNNLFMRNKLLWERKYISGKASNPMTLFN